MTREERSWVLYDWANSAYSIIVTTAIFPIFFKQVAAKGLDSFLSTAYWGYANSFYTLVLVVLAPVLGTLADFRAMKKRLFLAFLLLGVGTTASLSLTGEGQVFTALGLYILSALGFAGANIFYDSFLTDVTTEDRMDWISSSGFGWGYIGSVIPFVISILLIVNHRILGFPSSVPAVRLSFLLTSLWWIGFSLPILKNVQQRYFLEPVAHPIKNTFSRLWETVKNIKPYRALAIFLLAYFFYIDGVDTIIKMATPIALDVGISENALLIILLMIQIVAFPFALLYGKLARLWSAKVMLFVGIGIYIIITFIAFFLPGLPTQSLKTGVFWVLAMLVATSQGGIQALSRSYYGKLVPKEKSAEFFGFYNVFGKFAAIMGPAMVGFVSTLFHNTAYGILSVNLLFLIGGLLLLLVPKT
ncbi:MAG: MFS transporter [Spirochaetales bacterium]